MWWWAASGCSQRKQAYSSSQRYGGGLALSAVFYPGTDMFAAAVVKRRQRIEPLQVARSHWKDCASGHARPEKCRCGHAGPPADSTPVRVDTGFGGKDKAAPKDVVADRRREQSGYRFSGPMRRIEGYATAQPTTCAMVRPASGAAAEPRVETPYVNLRRRASRDMIQDSADYRHGIIEAPLESRFFVRAPRLSDAMPIARCGHVCRGRCSSPRSGRGACASGSIYVKLQSGQRTARRRAVQLVGVYPCWAAHRSIRKPPGTVALDFALEPMVRQSCSNPTWLVPVALFAGPAALGVCSRPCGVCHLRHGTVSIWSGPIWPCTGWTIRRQQCGRRTGYSNGGRAADASVCSGPTA